jgi:hypothetical protein
MFFITSIDAENKSIPIYTGIKFRKYGTTVLNWGREKARTGQAIFLDIFIVTLKHYANKFFCLQAPQWKLQPKISYDDDEES